jgi:hypothetical protein
MSVAEVLEVEFNRVQWVCHRSAVHAGKSARQWPPRRRFECERFPSLPQWAPQLPAALNRRTGMPASLTRSPRAGSRPPRSHEYPVLAAREIGTQFIARDSDRGPVPAPRRQLVYPDVGTSGTESPVSRRPRHLVVSVPRPQPRPRRHPRSNRIRRD